MKTKILIILTMFMLLSCTACNGLFRDDKVCYFGDGEYKLSSEEYASMVIDDGKKQTEINMEEGWAERSTLDFNKVGFNVIKPSYKKDELYYSISILWPEPDKYPFTYEFDYDISDLDKDKFNYFVHSSKYSEETACTPDNESPLVFPVIENSIETKSLKGFVTVEEYGDIGNFIIGTFELQFEDVKGNIRIIKDGKFKILRSPDRD